MAKMTRGENLKNVIVAKMVKKTVKIGENFENSQKVTKNDPKTAKRVEV